MFVLFRSCATGYAIGLASAVTLVSIGAISPNAYAAEQQVALSVDVRAAILDFISSIRWGQYMLRKSVAPKELAGCAWQVRMAAQHPHEVLYFGIAKTICVFSAENACTAAHRPASECNPGVSSEAAYSSDQANKEHRLPEPAANALKNVEASLDWRAKEIRSVRNAIDNYVKVLRRLGALTELRDCLENVEAVDNSDRSALEMVAGICRVLAVKACIQAQWDGRVSCSIDCEDVNRPPE